MARVQLRCFSFTQAYACVSVMAAAEAWAEATANVHASAVSAAVAGCGCLTDSVTDAFTETSLYLQLVAKAASTATATACLGGERLVHCCLHITKPMNVLVLPQLFDSCQRDYSNSSLGTTAVGNLRCGVGADAGADSGGTNRPHRSERCGPFPTGVARGQGGFHHKC